MYPSFAPAIFWVSSCSSWLDNLEAPARESLWWESSRDNDTEGFLPIDEVRYQVSSSRRTSFSHRASNRGGAGTGFQVQAGSTHTRIKPICVESHAALLDYA